MHGPPCKYFIFLTKVARTKTIVNPQGNASQFSRAGHSIAAFVAGVVFICGILGLGSFVDHPQTSPLLYNVPLQRELKKQRPTRYVWGMGALGAKIPRPCMGYHSSLSTASKFRAEAKKRHRVSKIRTLKRAYNWGPNCDVRGDRLTARSGVYPRNLV